MVSIGLASVSAPFFNNMAEMKAKIIALLLAVVTALTVSPLAAAKVGDVVFPAERQSQLTVQGARGFQITVTRIAGRVELTASNGRSAAIYIVRPPKAAADVIEATFPGLGEVSVRFHPSGRVRYEPPFCGGRAPTRQAGIFRGEIKFEGEQGFTRIGVGRAGGFVYRSFKESCKGPGQGHSATPPTYSLIERARLEGRTIVFAATKSPDGPPFAGPANYFASQWERRAGMTAIRVASASAGSNTFAIAGSPTQPESATVRPPSPFSGTASFNASPGSRAEWEGTLAVDLPGVGTVQLTGPPFRPELCLGKRCVGRSPL
jgi:hypothetical protein